jgi:hypothetical protein
MPVTFNIGKTKSVAKPQVNLEECINKVLANIARNGNVNKYSCKVIAMLVEAEFFTLCTPDDVFEVLHPTIENDRMDLSLQLKNILS